MQGKDVTEDDFISLCMNGLHIYDLDTFYVEKQLVKDKKSEITLKENERVYVAKNPYHFEADFKTVTKEEETSFITEVGAKM